MLILWFLTIYIVAYFLIGMFFNKGGENALQFQSKLGRTIDLIFLVGFIIFGFTQYYSTSHTQKTGIVSKMYTKFLNYLNESTSIFSAGLFIMAFYIAIYLFRIPMTPDTKPKSIYIIESLALILFVIILIVDFFKYVLHIPIIDMIQQNNLWDKIEDDIQDISFNMPPPQPVAINEVFNVGNNLYTYDEAQAVCSIYGAQVATYDQVESAYNNGGEWCNYGWSAGQMALFPTQKSTWNTLQQNPVHKNDCGRPGVNGGYIANPYVRFGINCYGVKPPPTAKDTQVMTAKQNQVYPLTQAEQELQQKVEYWKENVEELILINSYNTNQWSQS
jgi:hypothetical protein